MMPVRVQLADVKRLMDEGAQVVEMLPKHEYDEEHLPGAVSIPLKTLDAQNRQACSTPREARVKRSP